MSNDQDLNNEETPPLFQTWNGWYTLVIGTLVFLIGLFYWFTITFK